MTDNHLKGLIEHNENLNHQITEYLRDALVLLLDEKPFADISITELCKKAGVSRMAFYSNYKTKEDLYEEIVRTLNKDIVDMLGSPFRRTTGLDWYNNFFQLMYRNAHTVKIVFCADRDRYIAAINSVVMYSRPISLDEKYTRLLWTGGIVNATMHWIEFGMADKTPEEMAKLCFHTLDSAISGYPAVL